MLELRALSLRFGGGGGLGPIDLAFERDRTTVLIGPSGCGKSTLLRLVVGLLAPERGELLLDGERIDPTSIGRLRRSMGYVIQEGGLFPHLTAADNAALMARHLRWAPGRIAERLERLAGLVRLDAGLLARYPAELSGGQRQRVSLMRALFLDPQVLLLDEPLGALDPMVRAELSDDLRGIFRGSSKTVVLVTHDLREAGFFADRIVLLRAGRIVQQGSLDDLRLRPAEPFVEAFVRAQEHDRVAGEEEPRRC